MAIDNAGWQVVGQKRRHRRAPEFRPPAPPLLTKNLVVYGSRQSYAQVLSTAHPSSTTPTNHRSHPVTATSIPNQRPSHQPPPLGRSNRSRQERSTAYMPRPPRQPKLITSPDSPTTLKFPPTNLDPDWRNRCFRCFRQGHSAPQCANPRRCATCWGKGHDYVECPGLNRQYRGPPPPLGRTTAPPPPPPRGPAPALRAIHPPSRDHPPTKSKAFLPSTSKAQETAQSVKPRQHFPASEDVPALVPTSEQPANASVEPDFQDLLDAATPASNTVPPRAERPEKVSCFLVRDETFTREVDKLSKGLVISLPPDSEWDASIDEIAKQVATTGLVTPNRMQVAPISGGKFLVLPPEEISASDICLAFPEAWWTRGFSACLWSPWLGAEVNIPRFKVWLQLFHIPEHCWREDFVAQSISEFGTYLGTIVSSEMLGCWEVAVAVHDLREIPLKIGMTVGAFDYVVPIGIKKWVQKQTYGIEDFPQPPPVIAPPSLRTYSPPAIEETTPSEDSFNIKVKDLKQIFRNVDISQLPEDIAAAIRLPETTCDKGKKVVNDVTFSKKDLSVRKSAANEGPTSARANTTLAAQVATQSLPHCSRPKRLSSIDIAELQASVRGGFNWCRKACPDK